jgi:hypothetical protein
MLEMRKPNLEVGAWCAMDVSAQLQLQFDVVDFGFRQDPLPESCRSLVVASHW